MPASTFVEPSHRGSGRSAQLGDGCAKKVANRDDKLLIIVWYACAFVDPSNRSEDFSIVAWSAFVVVPLFLSVCQCLTVYQFLCFLACLCCIVLSVLPACLSVCLSVCLYVSVSRFLSVCQSVTLSVRVSSSHCSFFSSRQDSFFPSSKDSFSRSPVFFLPHQPIVFVIVCFVRSETLCVWCVCVPVWVGWLRCQCIRWDCIHYCMRLASRSCLDSNANFLVRRSAESAGQ